MIGSLPENLEVGGQAVPINADFRNILTIFEAYNDPELTDEEKAYICLVRLYAAPLPYYHMDEAYMQACWFIGGGDIPMSEPEQVRTIDWKHDESIIMPAVSKAVGTADVRSLPYLHWWTFLGAFGEIGEGLFSTVVHIRKKKARGEKLSKSEREFWNKNKALCKLITPEEQAAINETEAFLETII